MVVDSIQTSAQLKLEQFLSRVNPLLTVISVYYVPEALENNVGLTRNLSLIIGGCIQTMFVFGSLYPTFYADKSGRRQPMLWGSLGLGICMMMIAVLLSFQGTSKEKPTASAAVSSHLHTARLKKRHSQPVTVLIQDFPGLTRL